MSFQAYVSIQFEIARCMFYNVLFLALKSLRSHSPTMLIEKYSSINFLISIYIIFYDSLGTYPMFIMYYFSEAKHFLTAKLPTNKLLEHDPFLI